MAKIHKNAITALESKILQKIFRIHFVNLFYVKYLRIKLNSQCRKIKYNDHISQYN